MTEVIIVVERVAVKDDSYCASAVLYQLELRAKGVVAKLATNLQSKVHSGDTNKIKAQKTIVFGYEFFD